MRTPTGAEIHLETKECSTWVEFDGEIAGESGPLLHPVLDPLALLLCCVKCDAIRVHYLLLALGQPWYEQSNLHVDPTQPDIDSEDRQQLLH